MPPTWDWRFYQALAESVHPFPAGTPDEESRARAAISRAYYCAYNVAKRYVLQKGFIPTYQPNPDDQLVTHEKVWESLTDGFSKQLRTPDEFEAGDLGAKVKKRRVRADYRGTFKQLQAEARFAVESCRRICELLNQPMQAAPPWPVTPTRGPSTP